jgi:methionyl-tRNA formyltransferase
MTTLRVAFAGTPEFARVALAGLLRSHHQVAGVITRPDRPRGRGRRIQASPVKQTAVAAHLPVLQPETLRNDPAVPAALRDWAADVLVVVAYGLIVPQPLLDAAPLGSINIHASLLPRWRGAAPIQRALLAGDATTGITIMRMEAGLDTGPILLQRSVEIGPADTSGDLHDVLARMGAEALVSALDGLADGSLEARPQPAEGASHAGKIAKSEALITWQHSAIDIDRQVRALNPWPVAETRFEDEQLRVLRAQAEPRDAAANTAAEPGTVIAIRDARILVQCGEGQLALTDVQRPGRKPITAAEFARSHALPGRRFG